MSLEYREWSFGFSGLPDQNNKVSKLIVRTEGIRSSLHDSGNDHIEVLPVIVTSFSRETIQSDIANAASRGVVVVAKENIDALLERVRISPLPSQLFTEAKALLAPSPSLPPVVPTGGQAATSRWN